jgi:hypothetical protein
MAENGDIKAHTQTYEGFMTMVKVGSVVVAIVTAVVVLLIAS